MRCTKYLTFLQRVIKIVSITKTAPNKFLTNFLDISIVLSLIKNTRCFGDWNTRMSPSSVIGRRWGLDLSIGPNRVGVLLPDDGDRLQSPKLRVFLIRDRRWIMSKKSVILTTRHRHKPSELSLY
jgi:hypothetical protein